MVSSPHVLIVDDDPDTLRLYGFALELMGCHVVTAASGFDALRAVSHALPHVVVTDLAMPGMDGVGLCQALKADELTREIPVLAVSGHAASAVADRARAAGCLEVLLKPCPPDDLFACISRLLASGSSSTAGAPIPK